MHGYLEGGMVDYLFFFLSWYRHQTVMCSRSHTMSWTSNSSETSPENRGGFRRTYTATGAPTVGVRSVTVCGSTQRKNTTDTASFGQRRT